TITPDSKLISNSYVIQGVSSTPDPAQRQIGVRQLTATAKSGPKTVNTTGHTKTAATQATGTLTFYNSLSFSQTILSGTVFTLANGVRIVNDGQVVIPPAALPLTGHITVHAHAVTPGNAGNIVTLAINSACCADGVTVQNTAPFTGGVDPQDYHFVQQSDVDGVANPLKNTISAQAQTSLKAQFRPGEQQVEQNNGANPCPSKVTTDNPIGAQGTNFNTVTVTVTATCSTLVYDHNGLQNMVATLLASKANTDIGTTYKLAGQIVMHTKVQNIDQGNISLLVDAKGIWVAQFGAAQKTEIAKAIAGKSVAQAQNILGARKDIGHVDIQANGNVLPGDPNQITIVIQNVPGVQDTATPTSGGSGSSTPVNSPGGTQTPLPGKG
ncbi:MAG TPA: hypothetical protein VFU49_25205, partial [Ktedonobacteraceae bacterium]|nr:hypothetical protein [Ktedonobacteraceae bacterium]